ncbi:CU044_5270 family protein [Nonomuraea sp. NPDC050663]|uniref:CU044_5270 family protein n=1 Tax=Nonomuraea sp. NPDC050663 TaxID=3364370 RepID=UPI00378AA6A6
MDDLKTMWAEVPAAGRQDLAPARARLLDGMHGAKRGRAGVRFAVAGGLAAALAVGFVAVQVVADPAPANAQELLARAAQQAAAEPDLNPRAGQVVHTVARDRSGIFSGPDATGKPVKMQDEVREDWSPADSSGPFMMRQGDQITLMKLCSESFDRKRGTTYTDLTSWPTDVASLRERVRQAAAAHPAEPHLRMSYTLQDLIDKAAVRPSLRASLFTLISEMDGVTVKPSITDALGRAGVGVRTAEGTTLIFEPETYRYLGFAEENRNGHVIASHALEKVELLDRLPKEKATFTEPSCIPA